MNGMEIEASKNLTRELGKSNNFLKALDQYVKKPVVREKPVPVVNSTIDVGVASAPSDSFPATPAKRSGVVSCNTSCENASCLRTYDSGKKVRFQAKQVFDPFTNELKFDSGTC
jgi:hypothetical protein